MKILRNGLLIEAGPAELAQREKDKISGTRPVQPSVAIKAQATTLLQGTPGLPNVAEAVRLLLTLL